MQDPKESHGMALKQVLRYLCGTTTMGLRFMRSAKRELVGYSDRFHNMDIDDDNSMTGHIFYLVQIPIIWCSQKQEIMVLSSCEAEFMAATEAAKQAIWLQELLSEVVSKKVTVKIDNKSAIALTKNTVFHCRSNHIHRKFHSIRECVENEHVEVEHIPGNEQRADILIKALGRVRFKEMRSFLGLHIVSEDQIKLRRGGDVGLI